MENSLVGCCKIRRHPTPFLVPPSPSKPFEFVPLAAYKSAWKPPPPSPPPSPAVLRRRADGSGSLREAVAAIEKGSPIDPGEYMSLLQSCIDSDSIDVGRRLHASVGSVRDRNPFVETKLVSMYAKCGSLEEARRVFRGMRERNLFAWSAMIGGCVRERRWGEVVGLFYSMMLEGFVPDGLLITKILQACGNTGDVATGRLLHSIAARTGLLESTGDTHVSNSVLAMYMKCGELDVATEYFAKMGRRDRVAWNSIISGYCQCGDREEALWIFEQMRAEGIEPGAVTWNILIASYTHSGNLDHAMKLMKQMEMTGVEPDVFTWTSMISGFAQNNRASEALDLFRVMLLSGVEPNGMTVASAISACTTLQASNMGKELHSYAIKTGSTGSVLVGNSLIDIYAKCGRLDDAKRIFEGVLEKDIFTWNSMIAGYTRAGYCGKAYELFSSMENSGVLRNVITWNVMISGYIQNGDEDQAMELFHLMEIEGVKRNTATWNTLISGSLQNGQVNTAFKIFKQMQLLSWKPNSVTFLSILPACANLVSAWKVKEIHSCVLHNNLQGDVSIANALIDAYSKSGDINYAQSVFNDMQSRDIISWNSMIAGFVLHGNSHAAWHLFNQMKQAGERPNRATIASMINACALEGMITEGNDLFSSQIEDYQLSPRLEHYTGMVSLLGRSGRLREAYDLIEKMPIEPDSAVWNALLTAAKNQGNLRIANHAAEQLFKLEPKNSEIYNLLSHTQALYGKSSDASKGRKFKKDTKVHGAHGCCWIEVGHHVHTFLTGDKVAMSSEFKLLEANCKSAGMKEAVHEFDTSNLEIEEEKEEVAGVHSEKLALAFGLRNLPSSRSIRIIKSLRVCTDCHTTCKVISEMQQREILIKDPRVLHHFKDGKCSCRDYW